MTGGAGDDVIDGNTGNDAIFGVQGNDLIAGGVDNDSVDGGSGDDMIWSGNGDDTLQGGSGDDILFSHLGNDTLNGGGDEDAINRFHFYEVGGQDLITDFKVGKDLITLLDDIDPRLRMRTAIPSSIAERPDRQIAGRRPVGLSGLRAEVRAEQDNPIITISTEPGRSRRRWR